MAGSFFNPSREPEARPVEPDSDEELAVQFRYHVKTARDLAQKLIERGYSLNNGHGVEVGSPSKIGFNSNTGVNIHKTEVRRI